MGQAPAYLNDDRDLFGLPYFLRTNDFIDPVTGGKSNVHPTALTRPSAKTSRSTTEETQPKIKIAGRFCISGIGNSRHRAMLWVMIC